MCTRICSFVVLVMGASLSTSAIVSANDDVRSGQTDLSLTTDSLFDEPQVWMEEDFEHEAFANVVLQPVDSGSPRGGCSNLVYEAGPGGTLGALGISPGTQRGQGANLAPGDWSICRVEGYFANNTAPTGTPYNIRMRIWDMCPTAPSAPVVPCGTSTGATLLYESLADVAGASDSTGLFLELLTWTVPGIAVGGTNQVWITFEGEITNSFILADDTLPTIGSKIINPQGQTGYTLCSATSSGCNRYQSTVGGVPVTNIGMLIYANPVAGGMGACCLFDNCSIQTVEDCAASGGFYQGTGAACGDLPCPTVCAEGNEGQPLDRNGHGADNIVAIVSDTNPVRATNTIADNFTPTVDGTITHVRWWGYYRQSAVAAACANQGGSSADSWTITFYNDALDLPFQVVAGPFNVTPTKVVTGFQFNGRDYFRFDATGLNVPVLATRCYWMEILNHTTGECVFFWATAAPGDNKAASGGGGNVYVSGDELDYDMSWCLDIDINPNGCDDAVELPGACCLNSGTSCVDTEGPSNCLGAGGTFIGFLTPCTAGICQGACCEFGTDICTPVVQNDCTGTFQGIGAPCSPSPCSGACCLDQGNCQVTTKFQCEASLDIGGFGGSFTGGATCAQVTCATDEICLANVMACNSSITVDNTSQAEFQRFDPVFDATIPLISCYGGGTTPDNGVGSFWLTFTGTGMSVEVSTCNSAVNDTVMAVYQDNGGGCGNITAADEVACSEDDDSCLPSFNSKVCVPTINGTQYWIQVTSFDEFSVGSITVDVTCPCPVAACATCPGDISGDGERDGEDIAGFVSCLLGGGTNCICGDTNADTLTNQGDIASFVNLLLTSTGACP